MQHARARNRHLRHHLGVRLEELEMREHRMVREADLVDDPDAPRLGLDALELDAVAELVELDAVEHAVEVEMPPGAAKLAVGRELEADRFLLADDLLDLAVFHRAELGGADRARRRLLARLLERRRAEQRSDVVGAERRLGAGSHGPLPADFLGDFLGRERSRRARLYTRSKRIGSGGAWPMPISLSRVAAARALVGDAEIGFEHRRVGLAAPRSSTRGRPCRARGSRRGR